ncbi:LacI family transcriptional regulator [Palleronia aestuarii]|uniref:LacI family transcriptional regulator n=1 Tax=Palleronia aestuarii TaxID=568105 RepID=A0A2W7N044_9RHOB|nr:LacI family DNA-binding transcriptional regulator [Palleronia aestuarii]PZX13775.1 LacI family transcriptional regulator [Palleronia aestuarii]
MGKPRASRGGRTTIRDLAARAGTSVSTASLVMNGTWERYRITRTTADRVRTAAAEIGYAPNPRAQALRTRRSALAGMIVPHHRNRFFAGLAESFEARARDLDLVPIVVSTQRDLATEQAVARTLVAQEVEILILAGTEDPTAINRLCRASGIWCVNVDLPGPEAFSVVSDNRNGANHLTARLLAHGEGPVVFLGGREGEYATEERVAGFLAACDAAGRARADIRILRCGYRADDACIALSELLDAGPFPPALLINSITAFEGFASFWQAEGSRIGRPNLACFDWDPLAACLPLPIIMLRQNVEALIGACFDRFAADGDETGGLMLIPPSVALDRLDDTQSPHP